MTQPALPIHGHADTGENRSATDCEGGNVRPVPTARPANRVECPRCGAWWGGFNTAHCSACHRTFTGIKAFDLHRAGSHAHSTRHCLDPETIVTKKGERALKVADRAYPCWTSEGTWTGPEDAA